MFGKRRSRLDNDLHELAHRYYESFKQCIDDTSTPIYNTENYTLNTCLILEEMRRCKVSKVRINCDKGLLWTDCTLIVINEQQKVKLHEH